MSPPPQISPNVFNLLCFDKYDRTARMNINFDELVKFFIESRKCDLRDFLYEFSSTDWERNPLSGAGAGTPNYTFCGNIELDYMFIYLSLLCIPFLSEIPPISFEFWGYSLKDKIEKFKDIAGVVEIYSFKDSKAKLEKWLDDCDKLYKQKEEERVAKTPLNREMVSKYRDHFWEGYKSVKTFLGFCISKGHYSINNEASVKHRYTQRKDVFINEDASPQSLANRDGADISAYYDRVLLNKIINSDATFEEDNADDIVSMLNKACQWFTKENTNRENGILLFCGNKHIDSELYNNDFYVPSWREDIGFIFSGSYKNYRLINIYDQDMNPKCVALNLQAWKGLEIRPEVIQKEVFGEINIREWTEEEINEAISQNKIREEDRNRVKGQCPVEYELFWRLNEKVLPMQIVISLKTEAGTEDVTH